MKFCKGGSLASVQGRRQMDRELTLCDTSIRDMCLVKTVAPGLWGNSAQPAPCPASLGPAKAAEVGSCGLRNKARPAYTLIFFTSHYFMFSLPCVTDKIIINMFEYLLHSWHSSRCIFKSAHLSLTIALQAPYQPHFLAKETKMIE